MVSMMVNCLNNAVPQSNEPNIGCIAKHVSRSMHRESIFHSYKIHLTSVIMTNECKADMPKSPLSPLCKVSSPL